MKQTFIHILFAQQTRKYIEEKPSFNICLHNRLESIEVKPSFNICLHNRLESIEVKKLI